MAEGNHPERRELTASELSLIDAVCDRFEAAWDAGREPRIDAYLAEVEESLRPPLRRELEAMLAERQSKRAEIVSLERFVELLSRTNLISAHKLRPFLDGPASADRSLDARALALRLLRAKQLTEYQAKALLQGRTRGLVLGDYVVLDRIGAGGMGVVFKARHRRMDREVALKVLPSRMMKSPEAVERFYREVKAAARLTHPNVVTAHDAGEADGIHYFVMEYVDGHDLADLVDQRGPLGVGEAIDFIVQAASGLQYAHDQGIVHRDIKPSNMLLDTSGTVKILDLGLARFEHELAEQGRDRLTQSGHVMGTCDYMAPEQAADTHRADRRADIYSLGCSLYRLLTGKAMYPGSTLVEILLAHRDQPVPSLLAARSEVPSELDTVYQRMVAKQPDDRYQSMAEVVDALNLCLITAPASKGSDASVENRERSDSRLTAFLEGISSERETIERHVDMETGEVSPPPATAARLPEPSRRRVVVPRWLYGAIGTGAVLLLVLALAIVWPEGDGGNVSQIATGAGDAAVEAETASEKVQPQGELDGIAHARTDGVTEESSGLAESVPASDERTAGPSREPDLPAAALMKTGSGDEDPDAKSDPGRNVGSGTDVVAKKDPSIQARRALLAARQVADSNYAAALALVEEKVAAWDFAGALRLAESIQLNELELQARLTNRRDEIERMQLLKRRIIARIGEVDPPLRKSDLKIRGIGGQLTAADTSGITAETLQGQAEQLTWVDLGPQAAGRLAALVVDPANGDDCVAAASLALVAGDRAAAERFLDQAREAGIDVSAQLAAMASATLTQANELLSRGEFEEAALLLQNLQADHADLRWFDENRETFDAVLVTAIKGVREIEAESLYTQAVKLHEEGSLFDLRDVVVQLSADYADCRLFTESKSTPSLAELTDVVKDLGRRLVVRQDGKGDFTSIQAAIDKAPMNSLIEIQDNGPYVEELTISPANAGITLRGAKGHWPVITSYGSNPRFPMVLCARNTKLTLQRLILIDTVGAGRCMEATSCHVQIHSTLLYSTSRSQAFTDMNSDSRSTLTDSIILGGFHVQSTTSCRNCLFHRGEHARAHIDNPGDIRGSTFLREIQIAFAPTQFTDCILGNLVNTKSEKGHSLNLCGIYGQIDNTVEVKPSCVFGDPLFSDPANLDYRLMPESPCIGKASDGGDIGCRCTPEMLEMCRIALELRANGIIDF